MLLGTQALGWTPGASFIPASAKPSGGGSGRRRRLTWGKSWIGSLKRECLNTFLCFGLRQLDHIVQTYAMFHNRFRPHQGLGNRPVGAGEDPSPLRTDIAQGSVRCRRWLGGLLRHYESRAA